MPHFLMYMKLKVGQHYHLTLILRMLQKFYRNAEEYIYTQATVIDRHFHPRRNDRDQAVGQSVSQSFFRAYA